jgi:hypothetical protein
MLPRRYAAGVRVARGKGAVCFGFVEFFSNRRPRGNAIYHGGRRNARSMVQKPDASRRVQPRFRGGSGGATPAGSGVRSTLRIMETSV